MISTTASRAAFALGCAVLLLTSSAWAGAREDYTSGLELAESARFEQAVAPLRKALQGNLSLSEQKKARLALSQSLFYTSKIPAARAELKTWLKQFPNEQLDEALYPPDFVAFFKGVRDEVRNEAKKQPRPEPEPAKVEPKPDPVVIPAKVEPVEPPKPEVKAEPTPEPRPVVQAPGPPPSAPWYLKILPFGVGQFANGDKVGGGIWLGVELALVAANVSLAVYNQVSLGPDGGYPNSGSRALYIAQDVSAGLLIGTCIFGVIDAFVWSPQRAMPKNVSVSLNPVVPGASLAAAF